MLYVLLFRTSQSNFQGRLQPLLVLKVTVTEIKGTSVFTLFLIPFGKITVVVAIHKQAILSAAERWCPGCRVWRFLSEIQSLVFIVCLIKFYKDCLMHDFKKFSAWYSPLGVVQPSVRSQHLNSWFSCAKCIDLLLQFEHF